MKKSDSVKTGREKRQHRRSRMLLKVKYENAQDFLADYTENISEGGLFIVTNEKFEIGSTLEFEVSFPGLLSPIPLQGKVTWRREANPPNQPAGIGIQFEKEKEDKNRPIGRLVSSLQVEEKEDDLENQPERTYSILIVEDNIVVRDMFRYGFQKLTLQGNFQNAKVEILEADNGKTGMEILENGKVDLLVLDLYIPVLDGLKVIERVRKHPSMANLPIVVISAGGKEDREQALQAGADIFLSKPIKLKEMVDTIGKLIITGNRLTENP